MARSGRHDGTYAARDRLGGDAQTLLPYMQQVAMTDGEYWEYRQQRREEYERSIPKKIPRPTTKEAMKVERNMIREERWVRLQELKGESKWHVWWKMLPFEIWAAHHLFWGYYRDTPQYDEFSP